MIKVGTSTFNQKRITIGTTEIAKVYIGTSLVWTKQSYPVVPSGYGKLYNWYAANDSRNIAALGWHVPSPSDWAILRNVAISQSGWANCEAGPLVDPTKWSVGSWENTHGTNSTGFSALPSGYNFGSGGCSGFGVTCYIWLTGAENGTWPYYVNMSVNNTYPNAEVWSNTYKYMGATIRLVKDSTTKSNGQTGTYTGNDGKTYNTICIGTQEWLSVNLRETKYRNLSDIPNVTDPSSWSALTSGAYSWYDNNPGYE
jgi:uncharacterized protein (TIGR02145 family)